MATRTVDEQKTVPAVPQGSTWLSYLVLSLMIFCLGLGPSVAAAPMDTEAVWEETPDALSLRWDGQLLWRFHYGPGAAKPYFDPLAPPGGPSLVWNAPADHPWHHGLWFSWKFINGVNYWEETEGVSEGLTQWDPPEISTAPEGGARIQMDLRYLAPDGSTVLTEKRFIRVSSPDDHGYAIDWSAQFEAKVPALLDRTPITGEPGGQSWGGYAGLSVRMPKLDDPVIASDAGPFVFVDGLANRDARAVDYSGVIDGKRWGVVIFQYGGCPVDKTPWYAINKPEVPFHYFSPALLYRAPRALEAGELLFLKYRIGIHGNAISAEALNKLADGFERVPQ